MLTREYVITTPQAVHLGMQSEQSDKTKNLTTDQRRGRYFSESARRLIVEEIEQGLSKAEASRRYNTSQASIYRWISMYSKAYEKQLRTVIEHESESLRLKRVELELKEVYERLGRERAKSMFFEEIITAAEESLGMDLKKNFGTKYSSNSAASGEKTTKTKKS